MDLGLISNSLASSEMAYVLVLRGWLIGRDRVLHSVYVNVKNDIKSRENCLFNDVDRMKFGVGETEIFVKISSSN